MHDPALTQIVALVPSFADPGRAQLMVAMASTLAGNLTIVGSVTNLIVVEAAREARIDFLPILSGGRSPDAGDPDDELAAARALPGP